LLERWSDPQVARAGSDRKQVDGNAVAAQLCDTLKVILVSTTISSARRPTISRDNPIGTE
jgi:hypothetical protein